MVKGVRVTLSDTFTQFAIYFDTSHPLEETGIKF